ncbi:hypothetical protein LTR08_005897 [Meristemomyces frigidus]|nr:hypothetical protein LTR08_005897 [Meristemomyces frigidus]
MAQPPVLYRETRVTPLPSSILHIDTFGSQQRTSLLRAGSKRGFDDINGLDEESYARKHLATEGSVFFRSSARSPRSFFWRVLDDRKVLEIHAVDLVKESHGADSWLTYQIGFKEPIVPHGVAFADPEETDALECYVLTESKELFTVTLKRDLLTRASVPAEFDAKTCVKKYASSFLSVRHPYRLVANSSLELLVSLADGGLVRLERMASESGAQWRETFFSEGGWSGTLTLKRINPFAQHQTVRYGNLELDTLAVADMAKSPDGKYVWTVSLDHWLRAWSTKTGKIVAKMDLLNQSEGNQKRQQPYIMSAEQGTLLQIVKLPSSPDSRVITRMDEDDKYCLVIHSPKDHQFKFYEISYTFGSPEAEGICIQDLQSTSKLIPPVDELMNTTIWHLEQFHVQPGHEWFGTQLWIRARSGALCRTFTLTFDVQDVNGDAVDLQHIWQTGWSVVDAGPLTSEELKHCPGYPGDFDIAADSSVTPSERWLSFLFYPGRFSIASMETALHIYRKGRGLPASSGKGLKATQLALEERLTTAITSKILLRRLPNEQPDYDRYQQDIQSQWQTFYSLLSHLHNRRHESVALAFDAEDGLPWTVCADFIAPVRACSPLELRSSNTHLLGEEAVGDIHQTVYSRIYPQFLDHSKTEYESVYLSQLLLAARELRRSLSSAMQEQMRLGAAADAMVPEDDVLAGRAQAMFDRCGLDAEVTNDDYDMLIAGVASLGGLSNVQDDSILGLLEWIEGEGHVSGRHGGLLITRYGASVTIAVARETLKHAQAVLLDVLTLVVFMAGGLDLEELDPNFNADELYAAILLRLKRFELLLWMVDNAREHTEKTPTARATEPDTEITAEITLLEDVFIGDWAALESAHDDDSMPTSLSNWAKAWLRGIDIRNALWDGTTAHVLAFLVRRTEIDLAGDFLRFTTEQSAWSVYVRARYYLAVGDYAQASLEFQQAAEGCAAVDAIAHTDSAQLLALDEQSFFGQGLAVYFQHVTALFEKLRLYSYVADFANLALQHTEHIKDFARSMAALDKKKWQQNSPVPDTIAAVQEEQRLLKLKDARDEILNRLFNALVQTGRFSEAYGALKQLEDAPMKKAGIKKLVDACVKQDAVPILLELPFAGETAREADRCLMEMARKGMRDGTSSGVARPAYQTLYAFRTRRADFRGAAEVLYEHLERLKHTPAHHAVQDPEDETLPQMYVLLINTLACCGEEDAWLLAEPIAGVHREGKRRRLVRLEDLRREYTAELDKRSDMLHGRFALVGDEMDVL